jgi:hypothetical protein
MLTTESCSRALEAQNFAQEIGARYFEIDAENGVEFTPFQHLVREIQTKPRFEGVS